MCRRRLLTGYQRVTNYSLLSQVHRLEQITKKETRDQEVQTDINVRKPRKKKETIIQNSMIDNEIGLPPVAKSKQMIIKFNKMEGGMFKSMEFKFK